MSVQMRIVLAAALLTLLAAEGLGAEHTAKHRHAIGHKGAEEHKLSKHHISEGVTKVEGVEEAKAIKGAKEPKGAEALHAESVQTSQEPEGAKESQGAKSAKHTQSDGAQGLGAEELGVEGVRVPVHSHKAQEKHRIHRRTGHSHKIMQLEGEEDGDQSDEGNDDEDDEEKPWIFEEDDQGVSHLGLVFLVAGFIAMTVAAVFSLVMTLRYDGEKDARPDGPIYYYLVFFATAVSALAYYSMWEETAVLHVKEDSGVRVIFPERYLDAALTHSMVIIAISYLGKASTASMVGTVGSDLFMVGCLYVGAVLSPEHKFFWWGVGVVFFILLLYLILIELGKATDDGRVTEYDADTLRIVTYTNLLCWAWLPILWLIGQAGTASASLTMEIAIATCFDLLAKLVFCGTLLARLPAEGATNYGASYGTNGRSQLSSAFV